MNPYAPQYHELGVQLIQSGHVPTFWVYPPNWYLLAVFFAIVDLETASFMWNIMNIALIVAASGLLTSATAEILENAPRIAGISLFEHRLIGGWNIFCLHFSAVALLESTALTLSVGQTSILIYFGVSLLMYGLAKNRRWVAAVGLAIMFLKPQLSAPIFVALLFVGAYRMLVARAIAVALALSLPAFFVAPTIVADLVSNLGAYDGSNSANWPQSISGLRNLVWELSGIDLGNMVSALASVPIVVGVCATLFFRRRAPDNQYIAVVAVAATMAFAPLHLYDFVMVGSVILILIRGGGWETATALLGAALLWRADNLAMSTGFYSLGAEHFEGTRLATMGAMLIFVAVYRTVSRIRVLDAAL